MDINKTQALQDLQKALLSINGAGRRLGISTNEVVIILLRHDFSYFKNVLESGNAGLAKFIFLLMMILLSYQELQLVVIKEN